MVRQQRKVCFLETLKRPFLEYIILKIVNKVRLIAITQWLIFFRKVQPCKLTLQVWETFINPVLIWNYAMKRCLPLEESKDLLRVVVASVQSLPDCSV